MHAIKGVKTWRGMTVDELVSGMRGCAFGAGRLAKAVDIYEEMLNEDTTKFITIAGALVPAGMRDVIAEMVRARYVDVIITTGANLVHDIIEALGAHHYKIMGEESNIKIDDLELREQSMARIYDVVVHDAAFAQLEDFLRAVFERMNPDRSYSIREVIELIGANLSDTNSILKSAVDADVPVFCPAIADSMIGLHAWIYKQMKRGLHVDAFDDMRELVDIFCDAEHTGAIILGGGVPKNFLLQTALVAPARADGREGFDFAIQITTDTPENGSLSGATLEEAKSWGKIGRDAKAVTVYCDVTIALPVLFAAVQARSMNRSARR